MNPFFWSGPQFAAFYMAFAIVVIWGCLRIVRMGERRVTITKADLTSDPYRIAFLRGDEEEVIRVATFNLVDRGILAFDAYHLTVANEEAAAGLTRALDRTIVDACRKAEVQPDALLRKHTATFRAASPYRAGLIQRALMPSVEETRGRRRAIMLGAIALLLGVAGVKIGIALAAGRSNVGFLMIFSIIACVIAAFRCHPRLTRAGETALASMTTLVKRLQSNAYRLRHGGSTNEALLLAAVLGLAALPAEAFPFVNDMYPRPQTSPSSGGDGGGGGCGSGSSSSSGCGGGGGCGGCGG